MPQIIMMSPKSEEDTVECFTQDRELKQGQLGSGISTIPSLDPIGQTIVVNAILGQSEPARADSPDPTGCVHRW